MQRRKSILAVAPGEASEDGDFVALRSVREAKRQDEEAVPLPVITEETQDSIKRVSHSDISVHENNVPQNKPEVKSDLRDEFFSLVEKGSLEELKGKLNNLPPNHHLTSDSFRRPKTKENLLHCAFENEQRQIIDFFLHNYDPEVVLEMIGQDYEVFLGKLQGKKNILHKITEMKDVEIARSVVKKLTVKKNNNLMKLLKQETPVTIAGQRPRTFPCLHLAAFHGYTDFVQFYHDCGVDVNHINAKKDTALLWAARWGHEQTVRVLLQRGAKPNLENDKGSTALYWAVRYGFATTVKLLAEEGSADVNQTRKLGLVAPIVLASALGYNDIVKILLKNRADVNHVIRGRERPIHHAAREGHTQVLLTLLSNGALIDETDERGDTALILSARFGHGPTLVQLVKHGADINHKNHNGDDVWYFAVNNETHRILEILVQTLKNMDFLKASKEKKGKLIFSEGVKSPFLQAASAGLVDKIDILLNLNLDPTACDEEGNSIHHYAAMENRQQIIKKFHSEYSIDAQNNRGYTPLHIACKHGHHETISTLIELKAKASIGNTDGETALHVAALSTSIRPETVKMLIEHVIKTHTWESLNVMDNKGNNPLHIAAKFSRPDVLWEFRFVRLKDKDEDGNTPMHEAVRPDEPEALNTMLDIYETMKRDVDINEQNNDKSSMAHLAAMEGFDEGVKRLILFEIDLALQNTKGDTVLHCLTKAIASNPSKTYSYMRVFDVIVEQSVRWWCIKNGYRYPDDNIDLFLVYKRQAVCSLVSNIYNSSDLNVLALACRLGVVQVVERLMLMEHVMCFSLIDKIRYDITHITPKTNESLTGCCSNGRVVPRPSCLEWLLATESPERAAQVLDIPPMREIERVYSSVALGTYLLIIIFHIIYMILFSVAAVTLGEKRRNNDESVDTATLIMYIVVPIEPAILIFYTTYTLIKYFCFGEFMMKSKLRKGSSRVIMIISAYSSIVVTIIYAALVFAWIGLYSSHYQYHDYFLAPALLIGWCMTITYTRGFQPIHYFWRMIQNMIAKDVVKFIFFYFFILLGFSFAFHTLFQVSAAVIRTYPNPLFTMFLSFNMMIGMGELFDDVFETEMDNVGRSTIYPKIIYIFYMVLATIVLLNLLIAMMNTSYSDILQKQKLTWRIESVQLGVDLEKALPIATRVFGGGRIKHGYIVPNKKHPDDLKWFIEVHNSKELIKENENDVESVVLKDLSERVAVVQEQMKQMQGTLEDIRLSVAAHK